MRVDHELRRILLPRRTSARCNLRRDQHSIPETFAEVRYRLDVAFAHARCDPRPAVRVSDESRSTKSAMKSPNAVGHRSKFLGTISGNRLLRLSLLPGRCWERSAIGFSGLSAIECECSYPVHDRQGKDKR